MNELIRGDIMVTTNDLSGFVDKAREVIRQELLFSACSILSHEIVLGFIDSDSPKNPKDRSLRNVIGDMLLLTPEEAAVTTIAFDASHLDFSMCLKRIDETHYLGHIKNGVEKYMGLLALSGLDEVILYPRWKRQASEESALSGEQGLREEHWHNSFDEPDATIELSETHDDIVGSVLHEKEFAEMIVKLQPPSPFLRFRYKVEDAIESRLGLDCCHARDDMDTLITEWLETHPDTHLPTLLDVDDLDKTYNELDPSRFVVLDEELIEHIVEIYKEREKNNE